MSRQFATTSRKTRSAMRNSRLIESSPPLSALGPSPNLVGWCQSARIQKSGKSSWGPFAWSTGIGQVSSTSRQSFEDRGRSRASSRRRPNKELERTRSTQTAVGPRRSIQCSTLIRGRDDDSAGRTAHQYSALSAFERRGRRPRSKAPLSRCGWSGVQPRQQASSLVSEGQGRHPLGQNASARGRRSLLVSRRSGHCPRSRAHPSVSGSARPNAHPCASTSHEGRLSLWRR